MQEIQANPIMGAMPRPPSPKPDEPPILIQIKMEAARVRALDELRKREPDLPSRTDMVRRLIDRAATEPPKRRK